MGPVYTLYTIHWPAADPRKVRLLATTTAGAGAGLSTLPTRSFRQLTQVQRADSSAVQCSADTRHATVKSTQSQPLCTSAKSEIQLMVDRNADSSRQTWSCELQL